MMEDKRTRVLEEVAAQMDRVPEDEPVLGFISIFYVSNEGRPGIRFRRGGIPGTYAALGMLETAKDMELRGGTADVGEPHPIDEPF